jgi:hypothetical protein
MKPLKILGYIFITLGTLVFCYGFFTGFTDTLNPALIWSMSSSDTSVDSFFTVFWNTIAPWMILSTALFIVGAIGLIVGREPKKDKKTTDQHIADLEEKIETLTKRLNEQEKKNNTA